MDTNGNLIWKAWVQSNIKLKMKWAAAALAVLTVFPKILPHRKKPLPVIRKASSKKRSSVSRGFGILKTFGKKTKAKQKNAQGAVLVAGASRIWKFVKSNLFREYDVDLCWDLRWTFSFFHRQASNFVQSTAVCSATFRRDLLLQLLNPT